MMYPDELKIKMDRAAEDFRQKVEQETIPVHVGAPSTIGYHMRRPYPRKRTDAEVAEMKAKHMRDMMAIMEEQDQRIAAMFGRGLADNPFLGEYTKQSSSQTRTIPEESSVEKP